MSKIHVDIQSKLDLKELKNVYVEANNCKSHVLAKKKKYVVYIT